MKKIVNIMLALSLSLFAAQSFAGSHKHGEGESVEKHLKKMTKKLELTDEQKKQAEVILRDAKEKQDALDKKYNIKQYRAEKHVIHSGKKASISEILNDDQKAEFEEMCDKKKKKGKGKKGQSDEGPKGKK